MKAIVGGKIILPDALLTDRALLFDEKIVGFVPPDQVGDAEVIDAEGRFVSPGLVDMHIHGYLGEDASDGSEEGLRKMAAGIVKNGVTSWLPTTMTVSEAELRRAFALVRRLRSESREPARFGGAEILGVNAEGPYINPKRKGAQAEQHILAPSAALIREFADVIRITTIAPEMPGALQAISEIRARTDVQVSMGHTDASFEQAIEGINAGVSHVTHLFNAMTPLNHRNPGVVGAALSRDVSVEVIADAFHINPHLFGLVATLKGSNMVLVTDCTRAGGLSDGEYTLGGQKIFVGGIECRLADGTIAGSVLKLNHAVANVLKYTDLPVWKAVNMASLNPARRIDAEHKGALLPGRDADIIFTDEKFEIERTLIRGVCVYKKEA